MSAANRAISCPPNFQRRRIVAGMVISPTVLTETVLALVLKMKGSRKDGEIDFRD